MGYTLGSDIWDDYILYGKMVGDDFLLDKLVTRNNDYFEMIFLSFMFGHRLIGM